MLSGPELSFEIPDISKKNKKAANLFDEYIRKGKILASASHVKDLEEAIKKESNDRIGFFLALVLPIYIGKTQVAFTIRSKQPIYFGFDRNDPLLKNFEVLSEKLKELARDDREMLKNYLIDNDLIHRETDPNNPKGSSYDYIAINDFRHVNKLELKTLGLFMALMEDGETTKNKETDWMKHYARPRKITVEPISIYNFLTHPKYIDYSSKYLIFLDDFEGDFDLLFIRNLCRYLKFACMMTAEGLYDINIMSKEEAEVYKRNEFI